MAHYGTGWSLSVREGPSAGTVYPLEGTTVTLGRAPDNQIVLQDSTVSRHHARLSAQGGGYMLEDLGSANGTYVNNRRLRGRTVLRSGDTIRLGQVITLSLSGQPAPGAASAPTRTVATASGGGMPAWVLFAIGAVGSLVIIGIVAALLLVPKRHAEPNVVYVTPTPDAQGAPARSDTSQPTPTVPPTHTPYPTYAPLPADPPTYTPYPTYTPVPTAPPTYTPYPTYTPLPTQKPPPRPTNPPPTQAPPPTSQPQQAPYTVSIQKLIYEPWGRPQDPDGCNGPYRDRDPVRRLTVELLLTNHSNQTIPGDWYPEFWTSSRTTSKTCRWAYEDMSILPGKSRPVTFATHIETGEWITTIVLQELGYTTYICLNASGQQVPCN